MFSLDTDSFAQEQDIKLFSKRDIENSLLNVFFFSSFFKITWWNEIVRLFGLDLLVLSRGYSCLKDIHSCCWGIWDKGHQTAHLFTISEEKRSSAKLSYWLLVSLSARHTESQMAWFEHFQGQAIIFTHCPNICGALLY